MRYVHCQLTKYECASIPVIENYFLQWDGNEEVLTLLARLWDSVIDVTCDYGPGTEEYVMRLQLVPRFTETTVREMVASGLYDLVEGRFKCPYAFPMCEDVHERAHELSSDLWYGSRGLSYVLGVSPATLPSGDDST